MNKKDMEKLGLTAEALEKAELGEDVLDQLIILHGKDIEKHKSANADLTVANQALQDQLAEANAAIEGFKGLDVEAIKAATEEWKEKYETLQVEAETKVQAAKFDSALEKELLAHKVKNTKAVRALLKSEDLKYDPEEDAIKGLQEQLEPLQESDAYLFESEEPPPPKIVTGGQSLDIAGDAIVEAARKAAGLKESP